MSTCPACASLVSESSLEELCPPYRLLRCASCDLVFTDPMPSVEGEWYAKEVMYVIRNQFMDDALLWNHRQFIQDLPVRGGRLLDVGCGRGQFLAEAQRIGYRIAGLDFDQEAVQVARERFGLHNLFAGDLDTFRARRADEPFDVATAFEVLEHNPAPREFLRALASCLVPGGFLALSVPNRERWPAFRYDWDLPPHHLTRWSQTALLGLLDRVGFTVRRVAKGWPQGEPFLHQHLRMGVVGRLLKRGRPRDAAIEAIHDTGAIRLASAAFRVKDAAIKVLKVPLNLALRLSGETGMDLYVLAQRADR